MQNERRKTEHERMVFLKFIEKAGLPIDIDSVETRSPPEPDILCKHACQGYIAFELTELCDPKLAETIGRFKKGQVIAFKGTRDPTETCVSNKVLKSGIPLIR